MFEEACIPKLRKLAGDTALARRIYRTTGLPESSLDARIAPIYEKYKAIQTTVLAKPGQVDVRLTAHGKTAEDADLGGDALDPGFGGRWCRWRLRGLVGKVGRSRCVSR